MEAEKINERPDSIKLSHNSKGYTWEIKLYVEDLELGEAVINRLKEIDNKMVEEFRKDEINST